MIQNVVMNVVIKWVLCFSVMQSSYTHVYVVTLELGRNWNPFAKVIGTKYKHVLKEGIFSLAHAPKMVMNNFRNTNFTHPMRRIQNRWIFVTQSSLTDN
jgi:hypothetical protein